MAKPDRAGVADPLGGRQWFDARIYARPSGVDRDLGAILGCSLATVGPALGHGVHLDSEFVARVAELGNAERGGLKARFGHPNMCSTALGTFLGRWKSFAVVGDRVVADLYLSNSARKTPNGDLYDYVLSMAEREPDMFGVSIVFTPGATYRRAVDGSKVLHPYCVDSDGMTDDEFRDYRRRYDDTPGPDYVECAELHSADAVDEPAANPNGLFSRWTNETLAGQVTQFLDTHPEVLDILTAHPDVVADFQARYEAHVRRKEGATPMAEKPAAAAPAAPPVAEPQPVAEPAPAQAPEAEALAAEPVAEAVPEGPAAEPVAAGPDTLTLAAEPPAAEPPAVPLETLRGLVERYGADIACRAVLAGGGEVDAARLAVAEARRELDELKAQKGNGQPAAFVPHEENANSKNFVSLFEPKRR